jgi:elongation factor P
MSNIQATRLRKGMLITLNEGLYRVLELHHVTPGNKRGHVQCKMRDVRSGRLLDNKFRSEDSIDRAVLDERQMQYLYRDGDLFYFMDLETYEQTHLTTAVLGDSALYLLPESTIRVEFFEAEPVGIHLAQTVDLKVEDTAPGIKGATAQAQVKPATLETGLVVNVPAFVSSGDVIRVNTETGEYLSRA